MFQVRIHHSNKYFKMKHFLVFFPTFKTYGNFNDNYNVFTLKMHNPYRYFPDILHFVYAINEISLFSVISLHT
jgi:hypothetical protein